jgi:hypothetical protein
MVAATITLVVAWVTAPIALERSTGAVLQRSRPRHARSTAATNDAIASTHAVGHTFGGPNPGQ